MNPIKILVAGIANPHIPGYCRGFAATPDYPWQIVALAEHDPGRMAMAQRLLAGKEVKFYADWRKMLDAHPDVEAFQIELENVARKAMGRYFNSGKQSSRLSTIPGGTPTNHITKKGLKKCQHSSGSGWGPFKPVSSSPEPPRAVSTAS